MYGPRSIHAPLGQKAPVLSEEKDWATSGALPPRIAATILSSLVPPTTFTWTPGWAASKSLTTALNVFSSGATNGVQTLIVAGASVPELLFVLEPLVVDADDFFELPQPLAVSTSASSSRTVPSTRFIRPPPIWLGFRTRF